MDWLWRVDWAGLYEPKHALLDVFLRGTIMYLTIFVLLRLVVRRQVGGIGITDILVIVLIAEVTGNGISDNFQSIGEKALFLSDIFPTGYMAAENAEIQPGDTVAIWGALPADCAETREIDRAEARDVACDLEGRAASESQ